MFTELTEDQVDAIGHGLEAEGLSHSEIDEYFLSHYGKKGMKWGTRNQTRLDASKRVAAGKARPDDKKIVASKQSLFSMVRSGGNLQKAAGRDVMKLEAQKARIKAGEATTRDWLNKNGAFTLGANR